MSEFRKRITSSYLTVCSGQAAYEWLEKRHQVTIERGKSSRGYVKFFRDICDDEYEPIYDYLLVRRNDKLIDLGIAQFGYLPLSVRKVFHRGNTGVRCAALQNPYVSWPSNDSYDEGWIRKSDVMNLLKCSKKIEIEALIHNEHLPKTFFKEVFSRVGCFKDLSNSMYEYILNQLLYNPWFSELHRERLSRSTNVFDRLELDDIYNLAWKLVDNLEVNKDNASLLYWLLINSSTTYDSKKAYDTIKRWRIDEQEWDAWEQREKNHLDEFYKLGSQQIDSEIEQRKTAEKKDTCFSSAKLRSIIADSLEANDDLLNSNDIGLRLSFYRRFSPEIYSDWTSFVENDGVLAFEAFLDNTVIWKNADTRANLYNVASKVKKSSGRFYDGLERYYLYSSIMEDKNPYWFT